MVDSNQWLMDVINLETFISFSNDNPKSLSYNDICSRKKDLLATNSAYYYGSLALMDINMKIDGELGKIENVVFFGPRGQNLISYVNASNIVETINSVQSSNEIKEIFFFPSGRIDIKNKDNILIKFPIENLQAALSIANKIINNNEFKNNIIDLRVSKQLILSNE